MKNVMDKISVNQPPEMIFPKLENKKIPSIKINPAKIKKYNARNFGNLKNIKNANNKDVITMFTVMASPYECSIALDSLKITITNKQPAIKNQLINTIPRSGEQ